MKPSTIPADVATLARATPGQAVEVRAVLGFPGGGSFTTGDRVVCRDVSGNGLVVTTAAGVDIHVSWETAHGIQVERIGLRPVAAPVAAPAATAPNLPARLPTVRTLPPALARTLGRGRAAAGVGSQSAACGGSPI